MTTPAPGWLSDPTGRHEYRYWDGTSWSSDVSDNGVTGVDALTAPLAAPGAPGAPGGSAEPQDATGVIDPTAAFPPVAAPGPPTAGYGPAGGGPAAGPHGGAGPGGYGTGPGGYGTGPGLVPPTAPRRAGPSTGLLVGLGVLALALIVGIVVVLSGGGDDYVTSTADGGATTSTTAADDTATTAPDEDTSDPTGEPGDGGTDLDSDTRDAIVDVVVGQLEDQGMEPEQAECLANGILDGLDTDRLAEIGEAGGDISSLTPEEWSALFSAISTCGIEGVPGLDPSAGT